MGMDQYLQQFLSEVTDHLEIINESLLTLEKEPDDQETINKCFRSFHTLKGNAATMGFQKYSELAHGLEDILGKVRDKNLSIDDSVMDVLFNGVDLLEQGLRLIENGHAEDLDTSKEESEIKDLLNEESSAAADFSLPEKLELSDQQREEVGKRNLFRVVCHLQKHCVPMKVPKASIVKRELAAISAIIKTVPEELSANAFNDVFEVDIACEVSKADVESRLQTLSGFEELSVLDADTVFKAKVVDKDVEKSSIAQSHKDDVSRQLQSVKVNIEQLDKLMNGVGELLINNLLMQQISTRYEDKELLDVINGISRLTSELQELIMQVRMVPIGNIFNRFPRMVRDLSKKEGKKINFVIEGSEIEFDRTVLDKIGEPIVHLLRNSVDHGIESPEDRLNAGKSEQGTIRLIAKREKSHATIEIVDDGAGIDPQIIKASAIRKKVVSAQEAENMSDEQLRHLIFLPGMSTNEKVTEVSGRGVGMDVVDTNIKNLNGVVRLSSELGKGTSITLRLPLTVAIVTCLMVDVSRERFAIPISSIERTVIAERSQIKTVNGQEVIILREQSIPLLRLNRLFSISEIVGEKDDLNVIIMEAGGQRVGIIVDKVVSQQQILIKTLDSMIKVDGIGGATILGDGSVALLVDPATIVSSMESEDL